MHDIDRKDSSLSMARTVININNKYPSITRTFPRRHFHHQRSAPVKRQKFDNGSSCGVTGAIAVIGTGWYGKEFAKRLLRFELPTLIGSRDPEALIKNMTDVENAQEVITTIAEAIFHSDIIILAIPFKTHPQFIKTYTPHLSGKLLIDVSNGQLSNSTKSIAEHLEHSLASLTPPHLPPPRVVKAFNTISAYALSSTSATNSNTIVLVCGSNKKDVSTTIRIARSIGFTNVSDCGTLKASRDIEKLPFQFFREWMGSLWISVFTFLFFLCWVVWRYNIYTPETYPWHHLTNHLTNKAVAALSLNLVAFTYLSGCIAEMYNLT
ncbi:Metalloreductase steap2, partial [Chytridiales sp. JEL 0842]